MANKNIEAKIAYKELLKAYSINLLSIRVANILEAIKSSQESANSETKSSAGDKHETGRAMSQLETEMNGKQLTELNAELNAVQLVDVSKVNHAIINGSIVVCKHATFFIIAGIGLQNIDNKKVVFLSPKSPLAIKMKDFKVGNSFEFNKLLFEIIDVF